MSDANTSKAIFLVYLRLAKIQSHMKKSQCQQRLLLLADQCPGWGLRSAFQEIPWDAGLQKVYWGVIVGKVMGK